MNQLTDPALREQLVEPQPAATRRRRWLLALLVLLIAAAAAGYYYWQARTPATPAAPGASRPPGAPGAGGPPPPTPVGVATAKTAPIDVRLDGLGTVTPLRTVTVRSRVDGQLQRVLFEEGQLVKEGQLLAEIDPRPFQAQVAQYEGQLARDRALLENARIDLERYRTLFKQDSIASQQVDTQAALVRQYEGLVKADEGQADAARLQLLYSRVTAPVTGRVGLRQVDQGNMVKASDANGLVVITQVQPISVVFTLPQDELPRLMKRVQAGEKLAVEAWDREGKNLLASGTLASVDNLIDPATGTVKLRAQFPNADGALFPNQFVNARMRLETLSDATIVPTGAIQRGAQGIFVYVVQPDQTIAIRPVKLGPADGPRTAIAEGLRPGEVVVVDGVDRIRAGAKVEPVARDGPKPPEPALGEGEPRRRRGPLPR